MRENAHLYIRHDAHRFMRPDAPGWSHPDEKLRNLYFRFATRKALGLPPLTEADAGWQIILKSGGMPHGSANIMWFSSRNTARKRFSA